MKKLLLIAATAISCTVTIVACTKSNSNPTGVYSCICTYTEAGTTVTNQTVFTSPSEPKNTATTQCNAEATTLTSAGATGVSCHLQ